jgi:pyruvate formate lyase activating enzyme
VEITNLVIPSVNDDMQMIRRICRWLADNDLAEAPLHFSRFFPRYKMLDTPPTPVATLKAAKRVAEEEGIKHVYLGNVY